MKIRKGTSSVFTHERKVQVAITPKKSVIGYAFGVEQRDGQTFYCVTITKNELEGQGLECGGPCINRQFGSEKVKFI